MTNIILLTYVVIACIILAWLFCLISCIRSKKISDSNKMICVLLLIFIPVIGIIAYMIIPEERKPRKRLVRRKRIR